MNNLDRTCDSTEERAFLNYHKETLRRPDLTWRFDRHELHAVAMIYYKMLRDAGCDLKQDLPNKNFSHVLHKAFGMAEGALIERICSALSIINSVTLRNWINAMSLFLRGSLKQQIKYCFKVYDAAGKSEIRREQMVNLMRKFVYKHQEEDVDETVKDLVDIIIKKMDVDKDGIISYLDYKSIVLNNWMMLECFGQCLPDRKHVYAFLVTFTDKIKNN